jgi:hypothetical protein
MARRAASCAGLATLGVGEELRKSPARVLHSASLATGAFDALEGLPLPTVNDGREAAATERGQRGSGKVE